MSKYPYAITREQMVEKLVSWNPHWSKTTILNWSTEQLYAIYKKECSRMVKNIRTQLGLPN